MTPDDSAAVTADYRRLARTIGVVATVASYVVHGIRLFTASAALSAAWLWGLLNIPLNPSSPRDLAVGTLSAILLMVPAGILWLTARLLGDLVNAPQKLAALAGAARSGAGRAIQTDLPASPPRRIVRAVFDLWRLVSESKGMLLQYAAMVRFFNPATLVVILTSLGASVIFPLLAAIVTAWKTLR